MATENPENRQAYFAFFNPVQDFKEMTYTTDESFLVLHTFPCGSRNRLDPHQCPEIGRGLSDRPIIAIVTLLAMGLHTGVLRVIALHLEICTYTRCAQIITG